MAAKLCVMMWLQSCVNKCRCCYKAKGIDADVGAKLCVYMQMWLQSCVYRCRCGCKVVCIDVDVVAKLFVKMLMWYKAVCNDAGCIAVC